MQKRRENKAADSQAFEKIIKIKRVSKVVKGGKRFSFSSMAVVGDQEGRVGVGYGKANGVPEAIRKSLEKARKSMAKVSLVNDTIPHEVNHKYVSSKLLMKPAAPGTGIIACEVVRAVVEAAGVKNILTKSLGSNNAINLAKAAFGGLKELRSVEEIAKLRGKTPVEIIRGV